MEGGDVGRLHRHVHVHPLSCAAQLKGCPCTCTCSCTHSWGANKLSKPTTLAGFGSPSQCAQWAVGPFADLTIIPRQRSFLTPWAEQLSMFLFFLSLITHLYFWWKQRSIRNIQKADQNVWSRDVRKSCCRNDQSLKSTSQLLSLISFAGFPKRTLGTSWDWLKLIKSKQRASPWHGLA